MQAAVFFERLFDKILFTDDELMLVDVNSGIQEMEQILLSYRLSVYLALMY